MNKFTVKGKRGMEEATAVKQHQKKHSKIDISHVTHFTRQFATYIAHKRRNKQSDEPQSRKSCQTYPASSISIPLHCLCYHSKEHNRIFSPTHKLPMQINDASHVSDATCEFAIFLDSEMGMSTDLFLGKALFLQ